MADRLIFFGGSFDPVHHGHLIVARAVAEQLGFDRIVLVPAGHSPHKIKIFASAADRLAMLRLAVQGQDIFEVSDVEIARTGPSYTIDTLQEFRLRNAQARLAWIIGADMLAELPKWHRAKELVEQFELVIAARPVHGEKLETALGNMEQAFGLEHAARLRQSVVRTPLIEISSTDIRARIAQGKSIAYLVPAAVNRYIAEHGLYRA
jgi:nicotinate-nucleotide adenylyltransferase